MNVALKVIVLTQKQADAYEKLLGLREEVKDGEPGRISTNLVEAILPIAKTKSCALRLLDSLRRKGLLITMAPLATNYDLPIPVMGPIDLNAKWLTGVVERPYQIGYVQHGEAEKMSSKQVHNTYLTREDIGKALAAMRQNADTEGTLVKALTKIHEEIGCRDPRRSSAINKELTRAGLLVKTGHNKFVVNLDKKVADLFPQDRWLFLSVIPEEDASASESASKEILEEKAEVESDAERIVRLRKEAAEFREEADKMDAEANSLQTILDAEEVIRQQKEIIAEEKKKIGKE